MQAKNRDIRKLNWMISLKSFQSELLVDFNVCAKFFDFKIFFMCEYISFCLILKIKKKVQRVFIFLKQTEQYDFIFN